MSASRDDFGIAFRSALLQRGAAQKFSIFSLLFLAIIVFFLDVYGFKFMKPVRSVINDAVYRVSLVASSPSMRRALVHLRVGRMRIAFVELAQALCMQLGFSDASGVDFWLALI